MIGSRLGPYQLLAELGSGGMGKVYRAEVTGAVSGLEPGCAVALKVIHAHLLETPGFFKRFLREADIGRTIEHENVVRTYDCDALLHEGTQQNFLVMEYVEGQTLRDLLQELERVPEELCRHIGREVAKGLAAIHEAGVVHRDLKPENVLITPNHVVKIMDLGVARLQAEAIRLSQTGAFVGSLEYAAPEQFRSADGEPDGRADLHALGVVLYELATGQHPYRDEDVSKVLHNILDVAPRKAGEVNPQLSPFFEEVIQTLVAKDRDERIPAARDLAGVLDEGEASAWWKERAKALRVQTKRPLRRIRIPRETALYGRDDDLAWMRKAYEQAKEGDGHVLLIEGEAGIGKTRLVDEFVGRLRQAGEDVNFLFGSYPPGGAATASGAFSEAYREQFGAEGLEEALAGYLGVTPLLVPAFAALLRGDAPPKDAEPLTKDSLQTVFVHATRGLAAERTTIVLIDDLHFAPEGGRALFTSLAMAVPEHRILLIGTLRPGVEKEWTSDVARLGQAAQRSLSRLGPKDLATLLEDAFHSERLADELGMQIARKSDGNPFFAFEIIRGLREGQFITQRSDGTWVTTQVIRDIEVPSSVLDMVRARLGDLQEGERELLDVAACCGFEFDPGLVGDVVGSGRIPTLRALGRIERKHRLIRSTGRRYVFDHHQVREALYGELHDELRAEYHRATAEALETREGAAGADPDDVDGALCVDLCEHYLEGASGTHALRYLNPALAHLEGGFLNDQAIVLLNRVLDLPALLQAEKRVTALLRMNRLLNPLGRRKAQREVLAEASALAHAGGAKRSQMLVEANLGTLEWTTGRFEQAAEHYERSRVLARELGSVEEETNANVSLGHTFHRLVRDEEAKAYYELGLELALASGDRYEEGRARQGLGNISYHSGRFEEAIEHHERSLRFFREADDRGGEALASGNVGNALNCLGRYEEAKECHEIGLRIAREIGHRHNEALALGNLSNVQSNRGRLAEAVGQLERALAIARDVGDRHGQAVHLVNLGGAFQELGDLPRSYEAFESCLSICRETGARFPEGYALWGLGNLALEEGDGQRALEIAGEALALRRAMGHGDGVVDSLIQCGLFHGLAGDTEAAGSALAEAVSLAPEQSGPQQLAQALVLRARFAGRDAGEALEAVEAAGPSGNTRQVQYSLWQATHDPNHLTEAKRLLDHLVERAPEAYRESMLKNVRLNREIMEAWTEHGGEAATEAVE